MQADFSIELGGDDPALEIPWRSNDPHVRYYDLKIHPELVQQIPEVVAHPELGSFLSRINATGFPLATAKCDAWSSSEVAPEEEIFGDRKFVSYIDLTFVDEGDRCSFEKHETFAKELCRLLSHAPEIAATVEMVIRHCYYHQKKFEAENEVEQSSTRASATVRDHGMSSPENEDAMDHYDHADAALHHEYANIAPQDEHADVAPRNEPARVMDFDELANVTHHHDLADLTHDDEHVRVTHHDELSTLSEQRQSSSQESEKDDLPNCDDLFKTALSGKSGNVQMERKPHGGDPTTSVTGFCLTAYVTGFGDADYDPVRRWTIGLNLLQHAIVQLNSNSQPRH